MLDRPSYQRKSEPVSRIRPVGNSDFKPVLSEQDGQWTSKFNISPGASITRYAPAGWNPFSKGIPWSQQQRISSDADRQVGYLSGIQDKKRAPLRYMPGTEFNPYTLNLGY